MATCPHCNQPLAEGAVFCAACGQNVAAQAAPQPQPVQAPVYGDPNDHTAEFTPQDIAENKLYGMLCYLTGFIGIIISLLAAKDSPFAMFHVRQAIKFTVVESLVTLAVCILSFTIIVPIAGCIFLIVLFVIEIICFFQVAGGKAKDAAIIRSMGFLK